MRAITIATGNLGSDPELIERNGTEMCKFSLAVNDGYGEKKKTTWYRVTVFGAAAVNVNKFCRKGDTIMVEGSVSINQWTTNQGEARADLQLDSRQVTFIKTSGGDGGNDDRREERGNAGDRTRREDRQDYHRGGREAYDRGRDRRNHEADTDDIPY